MKICAVRPLGAAEADVKYDYTDNHHDDNDKIQYPISGGVLPGGHKNTASNSKEVQADDVVVNSKTTLNCTSPKTLEEFCNVDSVVAANEREHCGPINVEVINHGNGAPIETKDSDENCKTRTDSVISGQPLQDRQKIVRERSLSHDVLKPNETQIKSSCSSDVVRQPYSGLNNHIYVAGMLHMGRMNNSRRSKSGVAKKVRFSDVISFKLAGNNSAPMFYRDVDSVLDDAEIVSGGNSLCLD